MNDQELLSLEAETKQSIEFSLREVEVLNSAVKCSREVLEHHDVQVPTDVSDLESKILKAREQLLQQLKQKIKIH